jgi:hypothetical protein
VKRAALRYDWRFCAVVLLGSPVATYPNTVMVKVDGFVLHLERLSFWIASSSRIFVYSLLFSGSDGPVEDAA